MKALIVIDMQNGFMNHENFVKLKEKINNLLAENIYDKIFYTKFINKENSLYRKYLNWHKLSNTFDQDICVNIVDSSIIFEKYGYGLNQKDLNYIKNLGINSIDICGLQTDACVFAIAFQLFDNNIFPNILINYCETYPNIKPYIKEILKVQFGKIDEKI